MPQIRLGLQGSPGEGKTWSALRTTPNPIIANFDNKLLAHQGLDIPILPFNDTNFLKEVLGLDSSRGSAGHEGLRKWLNGKDALSLTEQQTLVIDSWTSVCNSHDVWWNKNPAYSKGGELDKWVEYKQLKAFAQDITGALKQLKCHVIVICHETIERDEEGRATGKLKPLMTGQFADQLAAQFTDWYRQIAIPKLDKSGKEVLVNTNYKLKENVEYFWQIQSDNLFTACTSLAGVKNKFVRADFKRVFIDKNFEL